MVEHRDTERSASDKRVAIVGRDGASIATGVLADVSRMGAGVTFPYPVAVPERFVLVFGTARIPVERRWTGMLGCGVKFEKPVAQDHPLLAA